MATRRGLKRGDRAALPAAGRWERRQILDEFTQVTGYCPRLKAAVLPVPLARRKNRFSEIRSGRGIFSLNRTLAQILHFGRIIGTAIKTSCGGACGGLWCDTT